MIPKVIHYCWFGRGEKSPLAKKCIESWHKYCTDFEIIEWNEDNFDIAAYPYAQYCYENKKYAFLSDFIRLIVINRHGGIYFDTDVEVVKPLESLLECEAFYGFENSSNINTGQGFGAEAGHITVQALLQEYLKIEPDSQGNYTLAACPKLNTQALLSLGLELNGMRQTVAGAEILPVEYLNPYDDPTGRLRKTDQTFSIHWYSKSWIGKGEVIRSKITKPFHRLFGTDCFRSLRRR